MVFSRFSITNYTDVVVFHVFENTVIKNNVSRLRNKVRNTFVVSNLRIAKSKFFPRDAACQMTCPAFVRTDRNIEARFRYAVINESRAPQTVSFFQRPLREQLNDRTQVRLFAFFKTMERNPRLFFCYFCQKSFVDLIMIKYYSLINLLSVFKLKISSPNIYIISTS